MAEKKATAKGAAKSKTSKAATSPASAEAVPPALKAKATKTAKRPKVAQKTTNRFTRAAPFSTFVPSAQHKTSRRWFVIDATDLVLGRAASRIARVLRGKHKPSYTPHADVGDFVIIINAEKVKLTGSKEEQKPYYRHSMHPGGLKTVIARDVRVRDPERLLEDAIRRMIPRNPLGRDVLRKLHVYRGPTHPHQAQKPEPLALT
jgi:large subunit ribosomal protein L13